MKTDHLAIRRSVHTAMGRVTALLEDWSVATGTGERSPLTLIEIKEMRASLDRACELLWNQNFVQLSRIGVFASSYTVRKLAEVGILTIKDFLEQEGAAKIYTWSRTGMVPPDHFLMHLRVA